MPTFRCYVLNEQGSITAAENMETDDLDAAIEAGWRFVAAHKAGPSTQSFGLEIWQGKNLLFTTRQDPTPVLSGLAGPVRQPPVAAGTNTNDETQNEIKAARQMSRQPVIAAQSRAARCAGAGGLHRARRCGSVKPVLARALRTCALLIRATVPL
jgi:hypothetical protein